MWKEVSDLSLQTFSTLQTNSPVVKHQQTNNRLNAQFLDADRHKLGNMIKELLFMQPHYFPGVHVALLQ